LSFFVVVLKLFFVFGDFTQNQALVVRVEDFNFAFGVVDFILGLDSVHQGGILNEGAVFLFDVDDLANIAKILKDVKDTLVIVV
jgi:hypothetical protein